MKTKPPSVAAYFEQCLCAPLEEAAPNPPEHSPAHPSFHIGTGCGQDCRAAIDAACELIRHIRAAHGGHRPDLIDAVRNATRDVVLCYVYG